MTKYENNQVSREALVKAMQSLVSKGLTTGTSGNISVRTAQGMLITPTGINPDDLQAQHIVHMDLSGEVDDGELNPSSEWRMHADIYSHKPGITACVHCHSNYATILACGHHIIPAQHYMVAASGNDFIPLAEYATFGSQQLSNANLKALDNSLACLLANHGQLSIGFNLDGAVKLAEIVEEQAFWYWGTLAIGGGKVLSSEQIGQVISKFASYGKQKKSKTLTSTN